MAKISVWIRHSLSIFNKFLLLRCVFQIVCNLGKKYEASVVWKKYFKNSSERLYFAFEICVEST